MTQNSWSLTPVQQKKRKIPSWIVSALDRFASQSASAAESSEAQEPAPTTPQDQYVSDAIANAPEPQPAPKAPPVPAPPTATQSVRSSPAAPSQAPQSGNTAPSPSQCFGLPGQDNWALSVSPSQKRKPPFWLREALERANRANPNRQIPIDDSYAPYDLPEPQGEVAQVDAPVPEKEQSIPEPSHTVDEVTIEPQELPEAAIPIQSEPESTCSEPVVPERVSSMPATTKPREMRTPARNPAVGDEVPFMCRGCRYYDVKVRCTSRTPCDFNRFHGF